MQDRVVRRIVWSFLRIMRRASYTSELEGQRSTVIELISYSAGVNVAYK